MDVDAVFGSGRGQFEREEATLRLTLNLRVQFDEVAELEAALLRKDAKEPSRRALQKLACLMYDRRRKRDRLLGSHLFGEPAWDMLLALYCLPSRGEFLTVSALSHAANIKQSTGLRWQVILIKEGLIERGPTAVDKRRQFVRLTGKGTELLETYLVRIYKEKAPPIHIERDERSQGSENADEPPFLLKSRKTIKRPGARCSPA